MWSAPIHQCWLSKLIQLQNRSSCCLLCLSAPIKYYKLEESFNYCSCLLSCLGNEYQSISVWRGQWEVRGLRLAAVGLCLGLKMRLLVHCKQDINFAYLICSGDCLSVPFGSRDIDVGERCLICLQFKINWLVRGSSLQCWLHILQSRTIASQNNLFELHISFVIPLRGIILYFL